MKSHKDLDVWKDGIQLVKAVNDRKKTLHGSRVLVLGVAYKKNVDDSRETPSTLKKLVMPASEGVPRQVLSPGQGDCNEFAREGRSYVAS